MEDAFHWYPGHMAKAKRAILEDIRLIDVIIELLDSRAPLATQNPDIAALSNGKKRVVVLNKSDLASKDGNVSWVEYYRENGLNAAGVNLKSKEGLRSVRALLSEAAAEKHKSDLKRGIKQKRPVRALVCGIPNVGKSTFINAMAGKNVVKTGNKPGVTKGKQWITVSKEIELLDSPGLLWPKIEDKKTALYLALLGAMNDEAINTDILIEKLTELMKERYPEILEEKYGAEKEEGVGEILTKAAVRYNMLKKGGEPDLKRAADNMLDDFRSGRLGRITLEFP
ncbi:MAG: ribosome biogenesis GTPase YlqF [Lachnospiraceae bacterium]|nr:ribosome biogenesis GTPase YlqF [Lachnospiraceae bacterium]